MKILTTLLNVGSVMLKYEIVAISLKNMEALYIDVVASMLN